MALLLTVDVGNTNIKLAAFDGDRELTSKSYDTNHGDYEAVMKDFADEKKLDKEIEAAMVSCVVPRIKPLIVLAIKKVFNIEPLMAEDYAKNKEQVLALNQQIVKLKTAQSTGAAKYRG